MQEEHNRKMQMLEAEHVLKMQALHWEVKGNMAKEQYWREGGPQQPTYTTLQPAGLPGIESFLQPETKPGFQS